VDAGQDLDDETRRFDLIVGALTGEHLASLQQVFARAASTWLTADRLRLNALPL
jgi:hypothetical protein